MTSETLITRTNDNDVVADKLSNLYILVYPDTGVLKIGKADNVVNRMKSLKWIGEADYEGSYWLSMSEQHVFRMETGFKKILHDSRINIGEGDGKTEIYEIACLEKVLAHLAIEFSTEEINQGVDKSNLARDDFKTIVNHQVEKAVQSSRFYSERANKQLLQIKELVELFVENHKKIPYEIIDGDAKYIRFDARYWPMIDRRIKSIMKPLYPERTANILQMMMFSKNPIMFISEFLCDGEVAQIKVIIPETKSEESRDFIEKLEEYWSVIQNLPQLSLGVET